MKFRGTQGLPWQAASYFEPRPSGVRELTHHYWLRQYAERDRESYLESQACADTLSGQAP